LLEALAAELARRRPLRRTGRVVVQFDADARGSTDPGATRDEARATSRPPLPLPAPPVEPAPVVAGRGSSPQLDRPARTNPRGSTPPIDLIVPPAARAEAEAQLDTALAAIDGAVGPVGRVDAAAAPEPIGESEPAIETVIEVEADEPLPAYAAVALAPLTTRAVGDHSDAEISIETLDEAQDDHPVMRGDTESDATIENAPVMPGPPDGTGFSGDEPSAPEIEIVRDEPSAKT
jgi:hypothetical protein